MWSRRQPLACVGAVLSLLDGPTGCDPAFCVVWFRFRLLRRYLPLWPAEVGWVYRLLAMVGEGCPGHGPIHLLSTGAAEIGFRWDPDAQAWSRPGLPLLGNLAGPLHHFKAAILDAWRNKVAADLCGRKIFRGGPLLDIHGSLQLLDSSHVRERDKALLRSIMVGWVSGMVCFLDGFEVRRFLVGSVVLLIMIVIYFGNVKGHWLRCLLWHGWLPMLSGVPGASPWASGADESARCLVEVSLGCYSSGLVAQWSPPDVFDEAEAASLIPDHPDVWTDGSLHLDQVTGVSSSGAGFFAHQALVVGRVSTCRGFFCSVQGPFQSVQ